MRGESRAGIALSRVSVGHDRAAVHAVRKGLERRPAHQCLRPIVQGSQGHRRPYHRDDERARRARDGEERVTTGFDANVPARKPRTISRVLTELTAVPDNSEPVPPPAAPKPSPPSPRVARGKSGQERTASLRERLAMTAHRSAAGAEPQQTAAAVRELIEAMRARLESAIEE